MKSLSLVAALVGASALGAVKITPAEKAAEKTITAERLRAHIRFLSSDLLEGRGPATRGDQLAQQYIATELEALGLKPGGANGSFFQPFDIVGVAGHPDTLSFNARGGKKLDLK